LSRYRRDGLITEVEDLFLERDRRLLVHVDLVVLGECRDLVGQRWRSHGAGVRAGTPVRKGDVRHQLAEAHFFRIGTKVVIRGGHGLGDGDGQLARGFPVLHHGVFDGCL
jgi:hypothetical protein